MYGRTKTSSQKEARPRSSQRTSALRAVLHCSNPLCLQLFSLLSPEAGQKGRCDLRQNSPLEPTAGSHPGDRLPYHPHIQCRLHDPPCVRSVWVRTGLHATRKSKEQTTARSMSHQCLGFLIHKDSYNTLSTEIVDIMVFYRKFYATNILIV